MNFVNILNAVEIKNRRVNEFIGKLPYLTTGGLNGSGTEEIVYVDFLNKPSRADLRVEENDLIIARMKSTNKVLLIDKDSSKYIVSTGYIVLKPKENIYGKYLQHIFKSEYFQNEKDKLCVGATQKAINNNAFSKIKIPLPPLPEQKRIADLLDKADSVRKKRKESIALLDEFLKSVFLDMFGDPVRNEKGWEKKKLNDVTKIGTGGTPSRKISDYYLGSIPWVKTTEVKFNYILDTEEKISANALKNSNCVLFPINSIIIALYGQGLTRGRSALLNIEATTNQACGVILPSIHFDSIFMWYQLMFFYNYLRNISRGGNQPNLNLSFVKELLIILPPHNLQTKFVKIVEQSELTKSKMGESLREMDNQFGALLQGVFR